MSRRSPFDFDISVSGDKKRRARSRGLSGAIETSSRTCDKPGCEKPGKFRAPKSPDHLDEFLWFCMDHIREYNLKWNFFQSHSDAELEQQFAADRVWERPTQPFSATVGRGQPHAEGRAWQRFGFDDPTEVLGDKATLNPGAARGAVRPQRRRQSDADLLDIIRASWGDAGGSASQMLRWLRAELGLACEQGRMRNLHAAVRKDMEKTS